MTIVDTIRCRAKVSPHCYDGRSVALVYEDGDATDDGTFRPEDGTVICDACYIVLMPFTPSGAGLHHELDAAIIEARKEAAP